MKRRLLSLLLALTLVIAIVPFAYDNAEAGISAISVSDATELETCFTDIQSGADYPCLTININDNFTINRSFTIKKKGVDIVIDGTGHTITAENLSGTDLQYVFNFVGYRSEEQQVTIKNLTLVVKNGYKMGIQAKYELGTIMHLTLENVNVIMDRTVAPVVGGNSMYGAPLIDNDSVLELKGNCRIVTDEFCMAAIGLSNELDYDELIFAEGSNVVFEDNRTALTKSTQPLVKLNDYNIGKDAWQRKNISVTGYALANLVEASKETTADAEYYGYNLGAAYPETWEPYYETLALKIAAQAELEAAKMLEEAEVVVKEEEPVVEEPKTIELVAKTELTVAPNGKKAVKVTWTDKSGNELDYDGYEIFRSSTIDGEYVSMFDTANDGYYNTLVKNGEKYFYKVRGYKTVDGEKVYSDFSSVGYRTVK